MHKLTAALTISAFALSAGTAAAEEPSSTDQQNASKLCKQLRTSSGSTANFTSAVKALVTTKKVTDKNAFGKCVSFHSVDEQKERTEAQSTAVKGCKAEREAATTDEAKAAFAAKYGAKNESSAYGKCVSSQSKAAKTEADEADQQKVNAAKTCKAERTADKAAFDKKYRNFGKCVSAISKAKKAEADEADAARVNAAKACKTERGTTDESKSAFAAKYRSFGKCVSQKAREANAARKAEQA